MKLPSWKAPFSRVLALASALLLLLSSAAAEPLRFVQLTDVHLGWKGARANLDAAMKEISALPFEVSFIVVTGDVYDKGAGDPELEKAFAEELALAKPPVYVIPGNHDIRPGLEASQAAAFRNSSGELSKAAEINGVQLLFLYAEPLAGKASVEGFDPLAWLDGELAKGGGKPALVFLHTPPFDSLLKGKVQKSDWSSEAKARFSRIVRKYPVKAVVCGHLHKDELRWDGDVPLFAAPPLVGKFGRQPSYRVYLLKEDGKLEYTTQYLQAAPSGGE